ncbi:hypothetical protein WJX74_007866 [Apatococcus lobatus]|uniref:Uncharacterized protein n=1 Tax=Apatococcus lobatus TaxID=904363 RepID=A0AAW1QUH9_9CHLO
MVTDAHVLISHAHHQPLPPPEVSFRLERVQGAMMSGGTSRPRRQMVNLGKVQAPKPVNLPSQRRENHGLDPSISLVPKHAGWGAPAAPSVPGTAPGAPSAWTIPGPGESLSPEPEGAPVPPPKGPPSGPPAAPPRAIPAGTPAYTPQPAWGGAGLPEARQEVSNLVKHEEFTEGQSHPGTMVHGPDGVEGKPHYPPDHGRPNEHGSMDAASAMPRAGWRTPEGYGFGLPPPPQQEQGPPPYDEYWRRAPWQGHPGMMPPPPQHRPWPAEHGPDERFGGPGRSNEDMSYSPAQNGPGPYIPPQQRSQGPPRYMEHPPPPPPPRAVLPNGHPGEMPFYHPHPPPQEGMPYPDPMHYPQHMDQAHGSQRFPGHSQENNRFQPGSQWGHAQMPSDPQEGHAHAHTRDGFGDSAQSAGYSQQAQQAEHGGDTRFGEGQHEDEGQPQRSISDADASAGLNESRDQKNVHSDWSSLADEPMDFGQAPAFAEDSSSAPQREASQKGLWRPPHQEQASGSMHPGQQEQQQHGDFLHGDNGDPHHPTKILQRSRTPSAPQHQQQQQPYMYMQGPPFHQAGLPEHLAMHPSHPPPPPPHPHPHLQQQQQQHQHFHQVQHQQQLLQQQQHQQQQQLQQQLPHHLLQRPASNESQLQPSSASATTSAPRQDIPEDDVTSLPTVQPQQQQEGTHRVAPRAGAMPQAPQSVDRQEAPAAASTHNSRATAADVHADGHRGPSAAELQQVGGQDAPDKQPAPLQGQQKSVELPDDLMVTHELPAGLAPFVPRPAGGLPSWQMQQGAGAEAQRLQQSAGQAVQFGTITPPQTSRHQARVHSSHASRQLHPHVAAQQPLLFGAPGGWTTEAGFRPASSQFGSNPSHPGQLLQQLFPGMSGSQGPAPAVPGPASQLPFRPPRPPASGPHNSQVQAEEVRQDAKASGPGHQASSSAPQLRQGPPFDKPATSRTPSSKPQQQPAAAGGPQQPQAASKGHQQPQQQARQQLQRAQASRDAKPAVNGPSSAAATPPSPAAGPSQKPAAKDGWNQPGAIPMGPGKDEWGDLEASSSQVGPQRGSHGSGRGSQQQQQQGGRGGSGRGRGRNRQGGGQGPTRPVPTSAAQGLVSGDEAKRMAQEALQQAVSSRPQAMPNQGAIRGPSHHHAQDAFDAAQASRHQAGPATPDRRPSRENSQSRRRDTRGGPREAAALKPPATAPMPQAAQANAQPSNQAARPAAQAQAQGSAHATSMQPGEGQTAERQPNQQRQGRSRDDRPSRGRGQQGDMTERTGGHLQGSKPDNAPQGRGGQQQAQTIETTVGQARPAAGGEMDLPQRKPSDRGGNRRRGRQDRAGNESHDAAAPSMPTAQGPPPGLGPASRAAPTTGPSSASRVTDGPGPAQQPRQTASARLPTSQPTPAATPPASPQNSGPQQQQQQQRRQDSRPQSSHQRDDRRRDSTDRNAQVGSANQLPASKMRSDSIPDRQGSGNEQQRQHRQRQQAGTAPSSPRSLQGRVDQRGPAGSRQNERQPQQQGPRSQAPTPGHAGERQARSGAQGGPPTASASSSHPPTDPSAGVNRAPVQGRSAPNASSRPPTRSGDAHTGSSRPPSRSGGSTPLPGPPAGPGPHRASTGLPVTPEPGRTSLAPPPGITPPLTSGAPQPRGQDFGANGTATPQGRADHEGGRGRQGGGRGGRSNRQGRSRDQPPSGAPEPPPGIAAPIGSQAGTGPPAGEAAQAQQQEQSSSGRGSGGRGRGGASRNSNRSEGPNRENSQGQPRQQGAEAGSGRSSAPRPAEGNENRPPRGRGGRGERRGGEGNRRGPDEGRAPSSLKPDGEARSSGQETRSGESKSRSSNPGSTQQGNQQAKAAQAGSRPDRPSSSGQNVPPRPSGNSISAQGPKNSSVAG